MKKIMMTLAIFLSGICASVWADTPIELYDLYNIMPLDDPGSGLPTGTCPTCFVSASLTPNKRLNITLTQPVGNVQIVVSTTTGTTVLENQTSTDTQIDLSHVSPDTYMLELYAEEAAVGGMFEVE